MDAGGNEPGPRPGVKPTNQPPHDYTKDPVENYQRLIAYMVIIVITLFVSFYILYPELQEYITYSDNTGFIGPATMIIGSIIASIALVYASYKSRNNGVLLAFIIYCVSTIAIYANLRVRANLYNDGVIHDGRGSVFIIIGIVSILIAMWKIQNYILIIPLLWLLFVLYQWWYY